MSQKRYRDKEWLYKKYWDENMTQSEIAELCDVTQTTIANWLRKHDIRVRKTGPQRFPHASFGMHHGYERAKGDSRKNESVRIHRLAAVAWFGLEQVKNNHIHHKNKIPWDNRKNNLEPLSPEDHNKEHHTGKEINKAQREALKIGWYGSYG